MPVSLLGRSLGPEGPRCRSRIEEASVEVGGVECQRERQVRGTEERTRETAMTLGFECHHGAKDPR